MTKITITFDDATMYIDKIGYSGLDISSVPIGYHALQWDGVKGWIEFLPNEQGILPPNKIIDVLPDWVSNIQASWGLADVVAKTKKAEFDDMIEEYKAAGLAISSNASNGSIAQDQVLL